MISKHRTIINAVEQRGMEYRNETNDCTVRALENATGIGYDAAYKAFAKVGRRDRRGTRAHQWTPVYTAHGFGDVKSYGARGWIFRDTIKRTTNVETKEVKRGMSVGRFVRENPTGTHILVIRSHAMCVKDGVVYDSHATPSASRVHVSFSKDKNVEAPAPAPEATPTTVKFDKKAYMKAYNARKKAEKAAQ